MPERPSTDLDYDIEKRSDSHEYASSGETTAYGSRTSLSEDEYKLEAQELLPIESQISLQTPDVPTEHRYSLGIKLALLAGYFILSLGLTLSNKALLGKARLPWLLTVMHASATTIGCVGMAAFGYIKVKHLTAREVMLVVAFSFLFTLNIAISNVSLAMVSVPFHQIMRSMCPIVTIAIYRLFYSRSYSTQIYMAMIPLIIGVGMATAGDYYFTITGFLLTVLGVILASVKTVATNRMITGMFSPLETLLLMSPLAATQCIVYAFGAGEVHAVRQLISKGAFGHSSFGIELFLNACTAFALNVISFQANKAAGALTMTVCGNVKQTFTIMLGIFMFSVPVGMLNAIGITITMVGAAYYSKVELDVKRAGR